MSKAIVGTDGEARYFWSGAAPEFPAYHDAEWGFPVADDRRLFEKLCLEGFSVRTQLANHPRQAREFPRRLPEFRLRQGGRASGRGT